MSADTIHILTNHTASYPRSPQVSHTPLCLPQGLIRVEASLYQDYIHKVPTFLMKSSGRVYNILRPPISVTWMQLLLKQTNTGYWRLHLSAENHWFTRTRLHHLPGLSPKFRLTKYTANWRWRICGINRYIPVLRFCAFRRKTTGDFWFALWRHQALPSVITYYFTISFHNSSLPGIRDPWNHAVPIFSL